MALEEMWADDGGRLAARIEMRLEQYKLHAESLMLGSPNREQAEALVKRLEDRLMGLRRWQEKQRD